ncbi:MAG: YceI family protein [Phycisphaerae bacterium]
MRNVFITSSVVLTVAMAFATTAAGDTYKVDSVHSSVMFRIKHMNVSYSYGRFNDISGTFSYDSAKPESSTFEIQVKTASVDTNNEGRDKHLRSAELFDAEKHPTISFTSKSVKKSGENKLEVTGDLSFHGVTKPLTTTIEFTGSGPGMRGETRGGIETVFTIKRGEFGMNGLKDGLGDEVRLMVSVEGVKK